mmetsp:Transcript_20816/g.31095  ORF Transcript_20816/g.31095 Transcript_20816/m.31095 type:complete len:457 (+) Transcript_20816:33-1403(+)
MGPSALRGGHFSFWMPFLALLIAVYTIDSTKSQRLSFSLTRSDRGVKYPLLKANKGLLGVNKGLCMRKKDKSSVIDRQATVKPFASPPPTKPAILRLREFQGAPGVEMDELLKDPLKFRVLTYNVLADGPRYALSDYHGYSPIEHRRWKSRYPRILSEIKHYDPDILCLQEVTRPMFQNSFYRDLQSEYTGVYAAKSDRRSKYQTSAMFLRTRRFKVLNGSLVSFARMSEDYFRSLGAHEGGFNDLDLMARMGAQDDKALIALLEDRTAKRKLIAISTHLYWNPKEPHVKSLQAFLLARATSDFIERHQLDIDEIPLVLGGDFNSLPIKTVPDIYDPVIPPEGLQSGVYAGITTGKIASEHPDHPKQRTKAQCVGDLDLDFSLESAYAKVFGEEPLITTKTDKFSGTLDYIFFKNLEVGSALRMPFNESSLGNFRPIPNSAWPSDHLLIASDLFYP